VLAGDRLLEVMEANGARHTLYGKDLGAAVNLIRGEPGSQLTLRVLRENKSSGQLEEYLLPITRQQLYLNEKALPEYDVTPR